VTQICVAHIFPVLRNVGATGPYYDLSFLVDSM
jgi:hypothetical protein